MSKILEQGSITHLEQQTLLYIVKRALGTDSIHAISIYYLC